MLKFSPRESKMNKSANHSSDKQLIVSSSKRSRWMAKWLAPWEVVPISNVFEQMHRLISFDFMNCGRGLGSGIFSVADWHLNTSLFIRDHTYHINIYIYMYKIQLIVNSWDCQIYFHRYKPTFAAVLRAQGLQKVHCTDCTCPSVEWGTWFQESHPHFKTVPKKHFRCYTSCFSGRMLWEHLSFQLFSEKMNHSIQQKAEAYGQAENSTVGPSVNPPPVSWAHSLKIFEEV